MQGRFLSLTLLGVLAVAGFGFGLHKNSELRALQSSVKEQVVAPDAELVDQLRLHKLHINKINGRLDEELAAAMASNEELQRYERYLGKLMVELDSEKAEALRLAEQLRDCRDPQLPADELAKKSAAERTEIYLESLLIPEINFSEAALSDVFEFLLDGNPERTPSYFIQITDGDKRRVTIKADRISLKEALERTCEMTDMEFLIEEGGRILVRPRSSR